MKVSILIPVYNEFLTLPLVLERVLAAPLPESCEREIVIVDDGSTDGTTELLKRYENSPLLLVHHSPVNFGKGAALRIGFSKATGDLFLIQDGDLEYDPSDFARILEPLVSGRAKIVYGSRFLGKVKGMKWPNWTANKLLTVAANVLYGAHITDEATAYKAFHRDVIDAVSSSVRSFRVLPGIYRQSTATGLLESTKSPSLIIREEFWRERKSAGGTDLRLCGP